jgi:hypothetical protein
MTNGIIDRVSSRDDILTNRSVTTHRSACR